MGDNIKMSKSLMNTISVKELLKSYTANQFRTLCLLSNYKNSKYPDNSFYILTNQIFLGKVLQFGLMKFNQ